jgi:electron transport complex protein RnfG
MTKEKFNDFVKPFVVLVVICVVVAFLLAFTNSKTQPIIEENERIEAERVRSEVLDGSAGFEEVECDTDSLGVESVYREINGLGYVITAGYKGYGGIVTVTVGIDNDGKVVGLNANVSTETTGVGSKAGTSAYTDKFIGISGSADGVDTISNATYSSTAVKTGVSAALKAYDAVKGAE